MFLLILTSSPSILIIQKLIETAVEARLKAQNDKKYFEDKYKAEKAKVDSAEDAAKVLEEEFTVSLIWTCKR